MFLKDGGSTDVFANLFAPVPANLFAEFSLCKKFFLFFSTANEFAVTSANKFANTSKKQKMNKLITFSILILSLFTQCKTTAQPLRTTTNPAVETDTIAEKMVIYQRNVGGWAKALDNVKIDYKKPLSEGERAGVIDDANRNDATIDNNATIREIKYLLSAYKKTKNEKYLKSAENGILYLLKMQYTNGGFPQFYPDTSGYRKHITFNDNAMVNVLEILKNVAERDRKSTRLNSSHRP